MKLFSKSKQEEPDIFFPGIYKFTFPYVGNVHDIGICDVELHIGDIGFNNGTSYLVTAFIRAQSSAPPLQHFIEEVCTKVRLSIFDRLLSEDISNGIFLNESRICWYEILHGDTSWRKVDMQFDNKRRVYHSPSWTEIQPLKTA
jgi:hypothetical protein